MAQSIQVDDIPDRVFERLLAYAQADGVSVPELIRRQLIAEAPEEERFGFGEWLRWLGTLEPIEVPPGAVVEALHAGRAERC